jgi:hypothetical protein
MQPIEICGKEYYVEDAVAEEIKTLRKQQCDVYNMNGLPCEHMDGLMKALDKKHFDGQLQDLFDKKD